jgi:retinol dehydrogenase 12
VLNSATDTVGQVLLQRNARVYHACRSPEKTEEVIKELRELTGRDSYFIKLDLADLSSVKAAAEEFQR